MPDFSVAYTINGTSTSTTVTADTFHVDDNGFLVFCVNQPENSGIYRSDDAVAAFREWDTVRPAVTPTAIASGDGLKAGHAWASKLTPPSVNVSEVRVSLDNEKIRDVISRVVDERFAKVAASISQPNVTVLTADSDVVDPAMRNVAREVVNEHLSKAAREIGGRRG